MPMYSLFVDVSSFIQQAVVLEHLSDAALIGVVQLLEDQNYLASIAVRILWCWLRFTHLRLTKNPTRLSSLWRHATQPGQDQVPEDLILSWGPLMSLFLRLMSSSRCISS